MQGRKTVEATQRPGAGGRGMRPGDKDLKKRARSTATGKVKDAVGDASDKAKDVVGKD